MMAAAKARAKDIHSASGIHQSTVYRFSFPEQLFPVCHVGEEGEETVTKSVNTVWSYNQRLNQVEYGRLSGAIFSDDGIPYFRNDGRHRVVNYITNCIPLLVNSTTSVLSDVYGSSTVEHHVNSQYQYFKHTYNDVYVPLHLLSENIKEENAVTSQTKLMEPCQCSLVEYVSTTWMLADEGVMGFLVFCGGFNGTNVNMSVVLNQFSSNKSNNNNKDYSTYNEFIDENSHIKLSCYDSRQMPGKIYQVSARSYNDGKILVAVRCLYFVAFFNGPSKAHEIDIRAKWTDKSYMSPSPVDLFYPLNLYHTSVPTASLSLCPYYYGEALFITETGGLYMWDNNEGVSTIQCPIAIAPVTDQLSHMWRCIYGPHPACAIICEYSNLSMVDFSDGSLTYTTILKQGSHYLISDWVISSIAAHPLHPFHLFVSTTDKVLLYDLRQVQEPLLEIRHELPQLIHYMEVVCCQWQPDETILMMSSLIGPHVQVIGIKGGYALAKDEVVLPPKISTTIHSLTTYKDLEDDIDIPSPHLNRRLSHALGGCCVIPVPSSRSFCCILGSAAGDLYYQAWDYGDHEGSRGVPYVPPECGLWVESVIKDEKSLSSAATDDNEQLDLRLLQNYITSPLSDNNLCIKCCALFNSESKESIPLVSSLPPPSLHGIGNGWQCSLCMETVETSPHHHTEKTSHFIEQDKIETGLSVNKCDVSSIHDELAMLWDQWELWEEPQDNIGGSLTTFHSQIPLQNLNQPKRIKTEES